MHFIDTHPGKRGLGLKPTSLAVPQLAFCQFQVHVWHIYHTLTYAIITRRWRSQIHDRGDIETTYRWIGFEICILNNQASIISGSSFDCQNLNIPKYCNFCPLGILRLCSKHALSKGKPWWSCTGRLILKQQEFIALGMCQIQVMINHQVSQTFDGKLSNKIFHLHSSNTHIDNVNQLLKFLFATKSDWEKISIVLLCWFVTKANVRFRACSCFAKLFWMGLVFWRNSAKNSPFQI